MYDYGEVERVVGEAVRDRRDEVELLSKVGLRWDDTHGDVLFEFNDKTGARRTLRRDSRPAAIRRDVEESLQRLQTDRIDLCQIHHPDSKVPIEESIGELERLVSEGKILGVGISNFTPPQIEDAIAALANTQTPITLASDQLDYSLLKRGAEKEIFPLAEQHGFGVLAYSPLDAGSLAGRLLQPSSTEKRKDRVTFHPKNATKINAALRECVQPIAEQHGATLAQVCLAWLLAEPRVSGVIAGASSPEQAIENAAADEVDLSEAEASAIGSRFATLKIDRYAGLDWKTRMRRLARRTRRKLRQLRRGR